METDNQMDKSEKNKQICFMYSGQGSQYFGMAKKLYEKYEVFRYWLDTLDRICFDTAEYSVVQELYFSNQTFSVPFNAIEYTHPAIFMVEYALTKLLLHMGIKPDILIGSSLGEYVAITVAECATPDEMLKIIIKQAFILKDKCPVGGMIAVLDDYQLFQRIDVINKNSELVSVNDEKHFVLSGSEFEINLVENYLKINHVNYLRLPVEYGFHSKNIESIHQDFIKSAQTLKSRDAKIKLYSSEKACEIVNFTDSLLWNIVKNKISFSETIKKLDCNNIVFIDLSPSETLSNITKIILNRRNDVFGIINPFHVEEKNIQKIVSGFVSG